MENLVCMNMNELTADEMMEVNGGGPIGLACAIIGTVIALVSFAGYIGSVVGENQAHRDFGGC